MGVIPSYPEHGRPCGVSLQPLLELTLRRRPVRAPPRQPAGRRGQPTAEGCRTRGRRGGRVHLDEEVEEPAAVACESGDGEEVQVARSKVAGWKRSPGATPPMGPPTPVFGTSRTLGEPTLRWRDRKQTDAHAVRGDPSRRRWRTELQWTDLSRDGNKDGWVGEKAKRPVPTEAGRNFRRFSCASAGG